MQGFADHSDQARYASLSRIEWWEQARLRDARLLVVGVGALGNEVLKNLALLGVGQLMVVDRDRVEYSNLTRSVLFRPQDVGRYKAEVAAERLRELNPDVKIWPVVGDVLSQVGLGRFQQANLVIACLDNRRARLWVNRNCWRVGRTWIEGAIQELDGVVRVFVPPEGPCYECGVTQTDYRLIDERYPCGQEGAFAEHEEKIPTTPTIASIVAGWQVQEAIKFVHGLPVAAGRALVFNGLSSRSYDTALALREDCPAHESLRLEPLALTHVARLGELFDLVAQRLGTAKLTWLPDRPILSRITCSQCQLRRSVVLPVLRTQRHDWICQKCGQPGRPTIRYHVDSRSRLCKLRLVDLGVPDHDAVRLADAYDEYHFLLAPELPWP